jgi:hypothetical protein
MNHENEVGKDANTEDCKPHAPFSVAASHHRAPTTSSDDSREVYLRLDCARK